MVKVVKPWDILVNYNELILHAIRHHACSPEDLAVIFKKLLCDDYLTEFAIRNRLKTLEQKRLVVYSTGLNKTCKSRSRRYYSLTPKGEAALTNYEELKDLIFDSNYDELLG